MENIKGIGTVISEIKLGIIGIGIVGDAMMKSFINKGYILNNNLFCYDKFKTEHKINFDLILTTDLIFLSLPTKPSVEAHSPVSNNSSRRLTSSSNPITKVHTPLPGPQRPIRSLKNWDDFASESLRHNTSCNAAKCSKLSSRRSSLVSAFTR